MSYYIAAPLPCRGTRNCRMEQEERVQFHPAMTFCPPNWASKTMAIMLAVSVLVVLFYTFQPFHNEINVLLLDPNAPPLLSTNERYLSVALDASLIANNFEGFDMRSQKLRAMMLPLGGAYLRVGGTMADRLTFAPVHEMRSTHVYYEGDGGSCAFEKLACSLAYRPNFTMSGSAWKLLNRLAAQTNFTILFDLNAMRRTRQGSWDAMNAESLIFFSNKHKFDLIWELGNEPNSYRHKFGHEISGEQLARDFTRLRRLLNKYPRYNNTKLVGPDVTNPRHFTEDPTNYLFDFLLDLDENIINAITWHQYYFSGEDAQLSDFLNPDIFDALAHEIDAIRNTALHAFHGNTPLWLGETSSAYGGGSEAYSDKFAATFIWLDKLGLAARNGIDLIVRQSLFKGHYALLDENYDPNPDWWISVIYKKLVGPEVLDCKLLSNARVRLYCHAANKQNGFLDAPSIVVFGSNLNFVPAYVRLEESSAGPQGKFTILEFIIHTHISIVLKDVYLNNDLLMMKMNELPKFKPKNVTDANMIVIPPYSLGFWLISTT